MSEVDTEPTQTPVKRFQRLYARNLELKTLFIGFGLILLAWCFALVAHLVFDGRTENFDQTLLLMLRTGENGSDPIGPSWFEEMARDVTALGGNTLLLGFAAIVMGYLLLKQRHALAALVVAATLGAVVVGSVLKLAFDRPRPDLVPHETRTYTASFPSAHATLAASTYLTLAALLARIQKRRRIKIYLMSVAITLSVLVGMSRVYLGVHWPTDVFAGLAVGAAWAMLCWLIAKRLHW